jgi:hypothetical protein
VKATLLTSSESISNPPADNFRILVTSRSSQSLWQYKFFSFMPYGLSRLQCNYPWRKNEALRTDFQVADSFFVSQLPIILGPWRLRLFYILHHLLFTTGSRELCAHEVCWPYSTKTQVFSIHPSAVM